VHEGNRARGTWIIPPSKKKKSCQGDGPSRDSRHPEELQASMTLESRGKKNERGSPQPYYIHFDRRILVPKYRSKKDRWAFSSAGRKGRILYEGYMVRRKVSN